MAGRGNKHKKESHSFFQFDGNGVNAIFNFGMESYGTYALAYYQAAQKLLQPVLESGDFADYDAYPILFLVRHYIELTLKEIIILTDRIANKEQRELPRFKIATHNLVNLLDAAERNLMILKETLGLEESHFEARTRGLILDLNHFDQESDAFRYPAHKNGEVFFEDHFCVGLPQVADNIEYIYHNLIGLTEYLTVLNQQ